MYPHCVNMVQKYQSQAEKDKQVYLRALAAYDAGKKSGVSSLFSDKCIVHCSSKTLQCFYTFSCVTGRRCGIVACKSFTHKFTFARPILSSSNFNGKIGHLNKVNNIMQNYRWYVMYQSLKLVVLFLMNTVIRAHNTLSLLDYSVLQ